MTDSLSRRALGLGYGLQLLLDCYGAKKELLESTELISKFLYELPEKIGMHRLSEPFVTYYDGDGKPEDRGVTGFVIICESHISCHTYPEKGFVTIDVYSCKNFDWRKTIKDIQKTFNVSDFEKKVVKRGSKFSKT